MPHPIQSQIRAVAKRARLLLLVYALCWFVGLVIAAAFALGLLDYLIRFQDPGVRVICSVSLLGVLLWSFGRYLLPAWRRTYDDVEVAEHVEQRFPQLRGRLTSSVAFLGERSKLTLAESSTLRQAVITDTQKIVQGLPLLESLDPGATRRALLIAIPMLLLIVGICLSNLSSASLAARRLAAPWSQHAWPRWNALILSASPRRLAVGQDFTISVVDRNGRLPEDLAVHFWFDGDAENQIESKSMLRDKQLAVHVRKNVTRSFRYRVTGGDDDTMEWVSLQVVDPPKVESLQIRIRPPTYSGIGATQSSGGEIRALEGSRLDVEGRASRSLSGVRLHVEMEQETHTTPALMGADRQAFSIDELPLDQIGTGRYWLELVEDDGVIGGQETRAAWQVVADAAPSVVVTGPDSDAAFTSQATVPLRVRVREDLAVRRVELQFDKQSISLFEGPSEPPRLHGLPVEPREHEFELAWDLRELDLRPQSLLAFHVVATDYRPQSGDSASRLLTLISSDDFDYRLQQQHKLLLQQLLEALRVQRLTRGQVGAIQTQFDQVGALRTEDVSLLQACELQQRQVQRLLGEEDPQGAARLIDDALAAVADNRASSSDAARLLRTLKAELDTINVLLLPEIRIDLARAAKEARAEEIIGSAFQPLLSSSRDRQDQVIAALEKVVDRLSHWDDYRRFARDLARLLQEQEGIRERAADAPTLGQQLQDLSAQERADLRRLSQDQMELASRFDRLRADMGSLRNELQETDAAASSTLAETMQSAAESQVAERMRSSAASLAENRLSNAAASSEEVEAGLGQMLNSLTRGGQGAESADATQRQRFEQELVGLIERQQELNAQSAAAERLADVQQREQAAAKLTQQQLVLAQNTNETRRELSPPTSFDFGMQAAEQAMRLAAERLAQSVLDDQTRQAQAEALTKLKQMLAAWQPEDRTSSLSSAAAEESPSGGSSAEQSPPRYSGAELRLVRNMQADLNDRTVEMDSRSTSTPDAGSTSESELQRLSDEQHSLSNLVSSMTSGQQTSNPAATDSEKQDDRELDQAFEELGIPGFDDPMPSTDEVDEPKGEDLGARREDPLSDVARRMRRVGENLRQRDTSQPTQQLQQTIVDDLDQMIASAEDQSSQAAAGATANSREQADQEPRTPPPPSGEFTTSRPGRAIEEVWGSLPDRVRQQIQSPLQEEFLPAYEQLIEAYYKRLAEEQRRLRSAAP